MEKEYRSSSSGRMRAPLSACVVAVQVGSIAFGEGTSESPREEVGEELSCSRIPAKAKAPSVRALSIVNSHVPVERMDVLDAADSFIRDDVWGTSGSHKRELNTEQ